MPTSVSRRPRRPFRLLSAAGACLLLSACQSTDDARPSAGGQCNDGALGWAVGADFDQAMYQRLLRESGAGLLNPIGPNSLVRGDSRSDRLRVYLDRDNRVTAARCE